ncbi:39S ribosomal protein L42, mitochondrial [Lutzomyia longipalpis]|uniref:39S ribosomal protein L42, mitochondrial n=1 Tax=Lutzomyia longipalpis TaxID=7200 RepID=UPI0024834498|nr:39S ribosomal protein L42, mitochondrial [Lutzomyia longipalpis]
MFASSMRITKISSSFSCVFRNFASVKHPIGAQNLVESIAVTDDGSTFVAWHPKTQFPYEFSKPIPPPVVRDNSSLLKDNAINTAMQAFKGKHAEVAREELMRITHTTKHRWFPRARDKKAKKDTPMDRPYL